MQNDSIVRLAYPRAPLFVQKRLSLTPPLQKHRSWIFPPWCESNPEAIRSDLDEPAGRATVGHDGHKMPHSEVSSLNLSELRDYNCRMKAHGVSEAF
jgi:hypothetical protein